MEVMRGAVLGGYTKLSLEVTGTGLGKPPSFCPQYLALSKPDTHLHLGGFIFHCMVSLVVTVSHTNVHPLTGLQEACGNLSVNERRCLGNFNGA